MIRLPEEVLEVMRGEAARRYPEECCGALLGWEDPEGHRLVIRAVPATNERGEERERRYLLGAGLVRAFEREAERDGLEVLGFFHSHPDAPAVPSEFDREHAWPWYSYLIVPVKRGEPGDVRCWRLRADRSRFDEEPTVPGPLPAPA